jgi:hypothetical protein
MPAHARHSGFEALDRLLWQAMLRRRCAHYERAISHRICDRPEDAGGREYMGAADRRNCLPERNIVWIDQTQIGKSEVRNRARGGSDVQGISRGDKDDGKFRRYVTMLAHRRHAV